MRPCENKYFVSNKKVCGLLFVKQEDHDFENMRTRISFFLLKAGGER